MSYLLVAVAIVLADQGVKIMSRLYLAEIGELHAIPGVLHFVYSTNPGASLGIFAGQRWPLIILSILASGLITYLIIKKYFPSRFEMLGLSFILGGAVGNLIDRIIYGEVTDMIFFPWIGKIPLLPSFICNVADIFITFGVVLFIIIYIRSEYITSSKNKVNSEKNVSTEDQ